MNDEIRIRRAKVAGGRSSPVHNVFFILTLLGLGFFVIDHYPAAPLLCTLTSASESVSIGRDGHGARGRVGMIVIMARPVVFVMIVPVAIISSLVRRFVLSMDALSEE